MIGPKPMSKAEMLYQKMIDQKREHPKIHEIIEKIKNDHGKIDDEQLLKWFGRSNIKGRLDTISDESVPIVMGAPAITVKF